MVDLHCHLLPGVDDGARSLSESLQMAALALQGGTTVIAATPHANLPGGTLSLAAYEKTLEELAMDATMNDTIRLSVGTEHIDDILEDLELAFQAAAEL